MDAEMHKPAQLACLGAARAISPTGFVSLPVEGVLFVSCENTSSFSKIENFFGAADRPLGSVCVWVEDKNETRFRCVCQYPLKLGATCIAWDKGTRSLFVGLDDGLVQIFQVSEDFTKLRESFAIKAHNERVTKICIREGTSQLLSIGVDKFLRVFDYEKRSFVNEARVGNAGLSAFILAGRQAVVANFMENAHVIDISQRPPVLVSSLIGGHEGSIHSVAFDARKNRVFTGSFDSTIGVWEMEGNRPRMVARWAGPHSGSIKSLLWIESRRVLISGGGDSRIVVWSEDGRPLFAEICHEDEPILSMTFLEEDQRLVTGGEDDTIRIWQFPQKFAGSGAAIVSAMSGSNSNDFAVTDLDDESFDEDAMVRP